MTAPDLVGKILNTGATVEFFPAASEVMIRHELKSSGQVFVFAIQEVRRMADGTVAIVTDGQEIK